MGVNETKWLRGDLGRMVDHVIELLPPQLLLLVCERLVHEPVRAWVADFHERAPLDLLALGRRWAVAELEEDELVAAAHRLHARCERLGRPWPVDAPRAASWIGLIPQRAGVARDAVEDAVRALTLSGTARSAEYAADHGAASALIAEQLATLVPYPSAPQGSWGPSGDGRWSTDAWCCTLDEEHRLLRAEPR
jgi:hypothetical protein